MRGELAFKLDELPRHSREVIIICRRGGVPAE
jgi:hypothetical protein